MTISSDELNYLIWRYLQEQGLEVSLYALQDETQVDKHDAKYNERIPIGCLINLIQKGILYCEEDNLVNENGVIDVNIEQKFNLFDALERDKLKNPTTTSTTTTTLTNGDDEVVVVKESSPTASETFTKILAKSFTFPKSQTNDWNPRSSAVLLWGQRDSASMITVLNNNDKDSTLQSLSKLRLEHPSLSSSFTASSSSQQQQQQQQNDITSVRWSHNGDMLVTASESGELRLWTTDGKLKNVMKLHNGAIVGIKWFQELILTKDHHKTIVWDSRSGLALVHLDETEGGIDACFIDENKIAVPSGNGGDHSIVIYDLTTSTPLSKLNGHSDNISIIDYNTDLKLLLSVSDDLTIRIWKGDSINSTQIISHHSQLITFCSWLPPTSFIISTSLDGTIRVTNIYNGDLISHATNPGGVAILQAALSPNHDWLATGDVDGTITIWDIQRLKTNGNGKKKIINNKSQYQPDLEVEGNFISCINWSQDSRKVAVSYSEIESVVLCI